MSKAYNVYLMNHKANVYASFEWMEKNIPQIFSSEEVRANAEHRCLYSHDQSKYTPEEYDAYDHYFYGGSSTSPEVLAAFNKAWSHHIHVNDHHWQHWVLVNDDPKLGNIALDMLEDAIIEMICDWWSFSFVLGGTNLRKIFTWYDEHKDYMILSDNTRVKVESILDAIRTVLNNEEDLDDHRGD